MKINWKPFLKVTPLRTFSFNAIALENPGDLSKILDHRRFLTEAAIGITLENSSTLYDRQIIQLNTVLLRCS